MKRIPLEDDFNDIVIKAQCGLALSDKELVMRSGVSPADLDAVRQGHFDEEIILKLAPVLRLHGDALVALARRSWYPNQPEDLEGLACFHTQYGSAMTVNSYLVWDPANANGVCFDAGADSRPMLQFAAEREIRIQLVLLTHTHPDHVADLARLLEATDAKAFVSDQEPFPGAITFSEHHRFIVGKLQIESRLTSGHSPGGTTYVIRGFPHLIAMVGDALFAGSMGGATASYDDALRNNAQQILTLAETTLLCPGHGPLTTVGEEKLHNPFFPQFASSARYAQAA